MFSAQKHEMPSDIPPETLRQPSDTGFGKVLNSIQGLQQRLDDFSIDEVTRAHSQAQELIRGFGLLQAQLNALTTLKDTVVSARNKIAALPEENFDLVDLDSFERHPQLRAIVKAAKLIRMHRILQAARASADSISLENSAVSGIDLAREISPTTERFPIVPRAENDIAPMDDGAAENNIPSDKAEADFTSAHEDQIFPPATLSAPQQSESPPKYEFAELKLDETQGGPLAGQKDSAAMADKHLPIPSNDKKPSEKSRFNERLLSDVIETYGEFALVPVSSTPAESAQRSLPAPRTATDLIPVQSAVESAFAQSKSTTSVAAPTTAPEKEKAIVNKGTAPSAKSRGEIDRELKNIIKDYGEYDLYSHQKSLNIKNAVIAVFTVLALIVGGFYFFKTATPDPAPVASEDALSSGRATQEIETPSVTQKLNETK